MAYLVVDPNEGSSKSNAASAYAPRHLFFARVVAEDSRGVVEDKPSVLPAFHDIRPFRKSSFHRDCHLEVMRNLISSCLTGVLLLFHAGRYLKENN